MKPRCLVACSCGPWPHAGTGYARGGVGQVEENRLRRAEESKGMDGTRKQAYRYLLYWAMLDIRPIAWIRLDTRQMLNPWHWRQVARLRRRAGVIADWLHNLALFSALDFEGFDEEWFWRELEAFNRRNPEYGLMHYRERFERHLAEVQKNSAV